MEVNNKTIWITGASSGIGAGLATALAACGAKLILSARSEDKLNALKQQLPNSEQQHHVVVLDLAQPEQLAKQLKPIIAELGTIDILINNGGLSQRSIARETQLSVHRQVMEVNYCDAK